MAFLVIVDDPVKTDGKVGMRIHEVGHALQFMRVEPIIVSVADGDVLARTVPVGV